MRRKPFVLEPAEFCITGARIEQWVNVFRNEFYATEEASYAIESPLFVPSGSVHASDLGDEIYGTTSELRV